MTKIEFVSVMAGTLVLDKVIIRLQEYYHHWKFNREFRNAQKRLNKCHHIRTKLVNIGTDEHPYFAPKCLDCYGLKLWTFSDKNGNHTEEWCANSAKP